MSEWRSDKGAKTTCQDGYDPDQCPLCEERAERARSTRDGTEGRGSEDQDR